MAITIPNIGRPNIRASLYIGFIVFQRKFCGTQFLSDFVSENLKIEIFDNGKYYKIDSRIQIENGDKSVGMVLTRREIGDEIHYVGDETFRHQHQ